MFQGPPINGDSLFSLLVNLESQINNNNKTSNNINTITERNQLKIIISYGYCTERYGFYLISVRQGKPPWCASLSIGTRFVNDLTRKLGAFPSVFLHFGTTDHLEIFLEHAETLSELQAMNFLLVSSFSSSWPITLIEYYEMKNRFTYLRLALVGLEDKDAGNLNSFHDLARYVADFESQEMYGGSQNETR